MNEDERGMDEDTFDSGMVATSNLGIIAIEKFDCPKCGIEPDEIHKKGMYSVWLEPCDHEMELWAALEMLVFHRNRDRYPGPWEDFQSKWPGLRDVEG